MNKDFILEIAHSCAKLTRGRHEVTLRDGTVFPVYIRHVNDSCLLDTWASSKNLLASPHHKVSSLIRSTSFIEENIASTETRNAHSFIEQLASSFSIPLLISNTSPEISKFIWNPPTSVPHISPIICIVLNELTGQATFTYYNEPKKLKKLSFYSLFPQYAPTANSMVFKFYIAQLLALFKECHAKNFYPMFDPSIILINEHHWIWLKLDDALENVSRTKFFTKEEKETAPPTSETDLKKATREWCSGKLTNFDYLMLLNKFAGRKSGDHTRHPVMPWVSDFTSPDSNYRPLNRTKYRLAKGEAQLVEQYSKQTPSYHVPELLSDICYMVYRARVESRENLSKHVRTQWVPEEYPTSMSRLYTYTPDECIPEFFNDPSIFKSIHSDMADLQLPEWAPTPEKFVKWHREVLESNVVSEALHSWIDLTFGYLLTGKAAVNALNVHLSFTEHVQKENIVGPVQLFEKPHPRRFAKNFDICSNPLNEDAIVENNLGELFSKECSLTELYKNIISIHKADTPAALQSFQSIAVVILELLLPVQFRDILPGNTSMKLRRAQQLIQHKLGEIPGYLRRPLKRVLLAHTNEDPISIKNILHELNHFYNLPNVMTDIHYNLVKYFDNDYLITTTSPFSYNNFNNDHLFRNKIKVLEHCADFPSMGSIWLDFFTKLLTNRRIAAKVCYVLLPQLSKTYERQEIMKVLQPICNVFDLKTSNLIMVLDTQFLINCSMTFGSQNFLETIVPKFLELVVVARDNLYQAVREIILWVARRYGPNLTAKYITSKLLCLLPTCYTNADQRIIVGSPDSLTYEVTGDLPFQNVSKCLVEIAIMFGSSFITVQYLPFCADVFEQAHGRTVILTAWESAMIASVVLLRKLVDCLTDKNLMDQLEDVVVGKILFNAVKLITSTSLNFSTKDGRKLLAYKTMSSLHSIADRLGAENVERYMAFAIQRLFSTFSVLYELDDNGGLKELEARHTELSSIFTPNFALLLVHLFSFTCGRQYTFSIIQNKELINKLEASAQLTPVLPQLDPRLRYGGSMPKSITSSPSSSNSLSRSLPSGNRISTFYVPESSHTPPTSSLEENFAPDSVTDCQRVNDDNQTHLQGTWVDHFRGILTAFSPFVAFDQIQLSSFIGHSSAIKKTYVMENENSFISASADKTIKLWSLKNFSEVCTAQMTYERHSKAVVDVLMLESEGKIVSTDGALHIWDPFCDKTLRRPTWQDSGIDVNVNGIAQQNSSTVLVSSQTSPFVLTYDTRVLDWANRFAVVPPSEVTHGVRIISISPNRNYLAVGLATGYLSMLDLRAGRVIGYVNVSDSEIVQLEWLSDDLVVAVNADHTSMMYELTNKMRQFGHLKEPITGVYTINDREYLTLHPMNRLRFHVDGDYRTEVKIHSEIIGGGSISTLSYMKLNQMFLVGSSSGSFRLVC
uniref:BEACH domain-containing protein n=1 Tax=Panagrellus redivivus TaxID=6233 RepID=A0A7E4UU69_PANRE